LVRFLTRSSRKSGLIVRVNGRRMKESVRRAKFDLDILLEIFFLEIFFLEFELEIDSQK